MNKYIKYFSAVSVAAALAACGGGGGDSVGGGGGPTGPAWQVAQLLETSDGDAREVDVSINASGVGYAVWQQVNGGQTDVFASRYRDGVWEAAQPVPELANGNFALDPQVAVLSDGEAVAIWRQPLPAVGTEAVFFNKTVGGVWQGAQFLQNEGGQVDNLQLVADSKGNAMAVWQLEVVPATNPRTRRIFAHAFRSGALEGTEQVNFGATDARSPDIAIDSEGNVLAVWSQFTAGQYRILARSNVGGIWQQDIRTISNPNEILDMDFPTVSAGADGRASAAWQTSDLSIQMNTATNFKTATWGTVEVADISATGETSRQRVTMDVQGNTTVVWRKREGGRFSAYALRRTPDGQISSPRKIDVDDQGDVSDVLVGSDASGRAFVVWEQSNGVDRFDLMSSRLEPGSVDWLPPELIENENSGAAVNPALAVNSSGLAIAGWQQNFGLVNPFLPSVMANVFR